MESPVIINCCILTYSYDWWLDTTLWRLCTTTDNRPMRRDSLYPTKTIRELIYLCITRAPQTLIRMHESRVSTCTMYTCTFWLFYRQTYLAKDTGSWYYIVINTCWTGSWGYFDYFDATKNTGFGCYFEKSGYGASNYFCRLILRGHGLFYMLVLRGQGLFCVSKNTGP